VCQNDIRPTGVADSAAGEHSLVAAVDDGQHRCGHLVCRIELEPRIGGGTGTSSGCGYSRVVAGLTGDANTKSRNRPGSASPAKVAA
jgi:hypothetical protein